MSDAPTIHTTHPCPHGERTDRTTRLGEPICALCRADLARQRDLRDLPDWQMLRAADDTLTDDERPPTLAEQYGAADREILAALFSDDSRGRRLRDRIRAYL